MSRWKTWWPFSSDSWKLIKIVCSTQHLREIICDSSQQLSKANRFQVIAVGIEF